MRVIRDADCPDSWARSPLVLHVLHLRAPSSDASGCNTASYEFISLVRNEEAGGSNPLSSTNIFSKLNNLPNLAKFDRLGELGKAVDGSPKDQFHRPTVRGLFKSNRTKGVCAGGAERTEVAYSYSVEVRDRPRTRSSSRKTLLPT